MGEYDESKHPRGEGGKFTAGGGAEHVGGQGRKARSLTDAANKASAGAGDEKGAHEAAAAAHGKARDAHLKASARTSDQVAKAGHLAAASNHAAQVTAHETKAATADAKSEASGKTPTEAFVDKHAPVEKKPSEKKPGEKTPKEHGAAHEAEHGEHEHGEGIGEWIKSKAEGLREGVKVAGEKANRLEESAMTVDPVMAGIKAAGGAIGTAKSALEKAPTGEGALHHLEHGH